MQRNKEVSTAAPPWWTSRPFTAPLGWSVRRDILATGKSRPAPAHHLAPQVPAVPERAGDGEGHRV
jgi:hypothetical protein